MKKKDELKYYEEIKDWDFDKFEIESESLTDWDFFKLINELSNKDSRILDLGTGGGERVLEFYPQCKEILGTDFSEGMIETANKNLKKSGRKNITFRIMDNLNMDVPNEYFDIVTARNTVTDPKQIYRCLKKDGYLILHGVDKYDCWSLQKEFGRGQGYDDSKAISIIDYENILDAGFKDVELVPIYDREFFKSKELFKEFLKKVPIIDDLSNQNTDYYKTDLEDDLLDSYIEKNTYNGKIKLLRRYYGIIAKK